LSEQADATFLRRDTALKTIKIRDLNRIIVRQLDIQTKYESMLRLKDEEIKDGKKSYDEVFARFSKERKRSAGWRAAAVCFGGTTIILTGIILLLSN
jgi:hypothetical protein